MAENVKILIDASTGEETVVPLTEAEIAEQEARRAERQAYEATRRAEAEQKNAAKASARAKLAALGLTAEEIASLIP